MRAVSRCQRKAQSIVYSVVRPSLPLHFRCPKFETRSAYVSTILPEGQYTELFCMYSVSHATFWSVIWSAGWHGGRGSEVPVDGSRTAADEVMGGSQSKRRTAREDQQLADKTGFSLGQVQTWRQLFMVYTLITS